MSFLIYLLIFSILPYFSTSYPYGIIRNASLIFPFSIPNNLSHQLQAKDCDACLCNAFENSAKVYLFTCTRKSPNDFTCRFYYFMPTRDEIDYPSNDTNIYVMKENVTFGEKDDCCNTTFLINKLLNTSLESNYIETSLRFLAFNKENNTIITSISDSQDIKKRLLIFDRSTLSLNYISNFDSVSTVGYNDGRYYIGTTSNKFSVINEALDSFIYSLPFSDALTPIRFLDENQMLVGTAQSGAYICERNNNTKVFENCTLIGGTKDYGQVHGFGVVNASAFYVGWAGSLNELHLYTKDQNKSWKTSANDNIKSNVKSLDIVIDNNCKRIWIIKESSGEIIIYDQTKGSSETLKIEGKNLFNLLIFDSYTLVLSHENGLSRIRPSLTCRLPRR